MYMFYINKLNKHALSYVLHTMYHIICIKKLNVVGSNSNGSMNILLNIIDYDNTTVFSLERDDFVMKNYYG